MLAVTHTLGIGLAFAWLALQPATLPVAGIVERIVGGDTVVLARVGAVRLIGVDTPESKHPLKPVQHFAREASAFLEQLARGATVKVARTLGRTVLRRSDASGPVHEGRVDRHRWRTALPMRGRCAPRHPRARPVGSYAGRHRRLVRREQSNHSRPDDLKWPPDGRTNGIGGECRHCRHAATAHRRACRHRRKRADHFGRPLRRVDSLPGDDAEGFAVFARRQGWVELLLATQRVARAAGVSQVR
jgi:hypothetical protein